MATGVVLHAAGYILGTSLESWAGENAHLVVPAPKWLYWLNNPADRISHPSALADRAVVILVNGNWYGLEGNPQTLYAGGGPASTMTPDMATTIDYACYLARKWILAQQPISAAERQANAKPCFKGIWAHRQASATAANDPGQAIYHVAHGINVAYGVTACEDETFGNGGTVIPRAWK